MRTFCNIITDGMLDYLVAIYELSETNDRISTSILAQKMEVSPAAASSMTKRLTETGHVVRTAQGRDSADRSGAAGGVAAGYEGTGCWRCF